MSFASKVEEPFPLTLFSDGYSGPEHSQHHAKYILEICADSDNSSDGKQMPFVCLACCIQGLCGPSAHLACTAVLSALEEAEVLETILLDHQFAISLLSALFNCSQQKSRKSLMA